MIFSLFAFKFFSSLNFIGTFYGELIEVDKDTILSTFSQWFFIFYENGQNQNPDFSPVNRSIIC
jgi:hypothetical protein